MIVSTCRGSFGDFSALPSYQEAQNFLIEAGDMFDALPSALRKRFGNDPAELLAFLDDPANFNACVELGLINKPVESDSVLIPTNPVVEPTEGV